MHPIRTSGASVRVLGIGVLALAWLVAPAAQAVPLYLTGGNTGFDPAAVAAAGLAPFFVADPSDVFLSAGAPTTGFSPQLSVVETARRTRSNPQATAGTPSLLDPARVDVTLRITNETADALVTPVLLFLGGNPNATLGDPAVTAMGLEADLLDEILRFRSAPDADPLLYGVLALPSLAPGDSVHRVIRYVVSDTMRLIQDPTRCAPDPSPCVVVPPYVLTGIDNPTVIPEPAAVVLLAAGLLGLFGARRRCG